MSKITLSDVASPVNEVTFVNTINNNSALIEAASDKFLYRDGTSPNTMLSDFDMNSHQILNLPTPTSDSEPVTLGYFDGVLSQEHGTLGLASVSTDDAICRFDGTVGNTQNSGVLIDDNNNISGVGNFSVGTGPLKTTAVTGYFAGVITSAVLSSTTTSSTTLHFAAVPSAVRPGMVATDASGISGATFAYVVTAVTATTITIGVAVTVASGTTVYFKGFRFFTPDGSEISQASTTTGGLQEALNASVAVGLPLHVYGKGGIEPPVNTVGNAWLGSASPITVPASLFADVRFYNVQLDIWNDTNGLIFDSQEFLRFLGPTIVTYHGNGAAVAFKPSTNNPVDANSAIDCCEFNFGAIVCQSGSTSAVPVLFDLTGGSVYRNKFTFQELFGTHNNDSTVTASCLIVKNQTASNGFYENIVEMQSAHGFTGNCIQVGLSTTNQSTLHDNKWTIGVISPSSAATAACGLSTYASYETYNVSINTEEGGTLANPVIFQSGANYNAASLSYSGTISASPIINNTGLGNVIRENGLTKFQAAANNTAAIRIAQSNGSQSYWDMAPEESQGALDFYRVGDRVIRFSPTGLLTLGKAAVGTGKISLVGTTSGAIAINPQDAAGSYNFNLPSTAGSSGQFLTSAGGGSSAMTWTTPASESLAGDVTGTLGATVLATVNSNVGSFGSSSAIPVITVNGKGLITAVTTASAGLIVATSTITSGTTTRVLYDNSGVLGEYAISGSGSVAMTTSPTFVTPALGTPASGVATNLIGTASGLTAGNVTTNANLTGVVTSVGNATSFATSPTFTGTVTHPTPFTLGAVSVTTTGTQLNYLNAATGTTGTTSTNVVFSASPTLTGTLTVGGGTIVNSGGFYTFNTAGATDYYQFEFSGAARFALQGVSSTVVGATVSSASFFAATGGTATSSIDTTLSRVSAGIWQVGTTAANALGSLNLTNLTASGTITRTGVQSNAILTTVNTNYNLWTMNGVTTEAGAIGFSGGATGDPNMRLYVPSGGSFFFEVNGVQSKVSFDSSGNIVSAGSITAGGIIKLQSYTVAGLPSASTSGAGATAFVTDASTTLILGLGGTVAGGGSNKVPVYSDGTNWVYG